MSFSIMGIVALIAAVWVIYDVLTKQKRMSDGMRLVWVILAIVLNIITAILYFFIVKKGKL
ncbi:MAG: PLDc N-terminal domain-containing protein [bacterium]|nr:PLDc N-terminal domain-containing protein [bacterium]